MKTRIITAIIAILLFVPIVLYGSWPLLVLVYCMATIGLLELLNMRQRAYAFLPACLSLVMLWILLAQQTSLLGEIIPFSEIEVLIVFTMILLFLTVASKNQLSVEKVGFYLIATMYIAMGFAFFVEARNNGLADVLFVLFVIWATDSGAYFVGRSVGKRKLWPSISPNKTIGGALGGIALALITGIVFHLIEPFSYSLVTIALIAIGISIVGQLGDLVASAFKRHFGVKDSGTIFPGHGGILDRFDSLLFVLPFLYVIQFI